MIHNIFFKDICLGTSLDNSIIVLLIEIKNRCKAVKIYVLISIYICRYGFKIYLNNNQLLISINVAP